MAKDTGTAIKFVVDTHVHADHVSSGRDLAREAGAEYVAVLPGAFSGSVCGRGLSGNPGSTIGFERRFNTAFRIDDRNAFVALMMRDVPPRPPDAARVRAANLGHLDP